MIISCIKCNKKFEVPDNLIPKSGRTLQCGSCSYEWHYVPIIRVYQSEKENNADFIVNTETTENTKNQEILKEDEPEVFEQIKDEIVPKKEYSNNNIEKNISKKVSSSFFNKLLVWIITFIALLIILDTFKVQLENIYPPLEMYLYNLYESIKDISLFVINLIK